ncbi:MAG: c-type cytochrome domain-containing protein, partial [Verrucomicrobiota bacterium]
MEAEHRTSKANRPERRFATGFRIARAKAGYKPALRVGQLERLSLRLGVRCLMVAIWSLLLLPSAIFASEVDVSKLPPPAKIPIDFVRDIQPIFETSCLRCHGPEKPKSRFRLDNREAGLKGGETGVAIFPGDSAKSPLIHYVAGLVEDMQMPPLGKGDPLTPEQIGLLRAWIDQGANWPSNQPQSQLAFSIAPTFRYIHVEGDKKSFREIEGHREDGAGGIESFSIREKIAADTTVSAEGHALFGDDDVAVKLSLDKTETGFIRGGVEQWRKYYDDSGVYYPQPFIPSMISLDRNLHLDIGRAWIDFGLALPHWPQMILGYEYQWKDGEKSTLQYGNVNGKNIYPAWKQIDEQTHILKFDLVHELYDWRIEDNARVEFYDLKMRRENAFHSFGVVPDTISRIDEKSRHTQGMNTIRAERQIGDWIFLGSGYFYSRYEGDASYDLRTMDNTGVLVTGPFWFGDNIILKRETHLFSLSSALTGVEGLSVSLGIQNEWNRQEGFGKILLDEGDPSNPAAFTLQPASLDSNLDKEKFSENFAVRFTRIPWTVLFADVHWEDESVGQFEEQRGGDEFARHTDAENIRQQYRLGFNTSPWRAVSFTGEYKKKLSDTDYDNFERAFYLSNGIPQPFLTDGYSAFISERNINTDEVVAKLVVNPTRWLKTTLSYRVFATDYSTTTDALGDSSIAPGGRIFAGNTDGHVVSLNASVTPFTRLYLSTTFSYSNTRTVTADHGNLSVVPYRGDIYSAIANANFVLNKSTDLQASYSFSEANYSQHNLTDGVPLGIDFARHVISFGAAKRWTDYMSTNLRYNFYHYSEPSSGGENNYVAHGIFATLSLKWP